jgi:hypothetical protein
MGRHDAPSAAARAKVRAERKKKERATKRRERHDERYNELKRYDHSGPKTVWPVAKSRAPKRPARAKRPVNRVP